MGTSARIGGIHTRETLPLSPTLYSFGPFFLDSAERILSKDGVPLQLSPRAFDTLLLLVDRAPHLISKSVLMDTVWAESFVEEANLVVVVSVLRKALGDDGQERKYIQTVPKLGYRFIAEVRRSDGSNGLSEPRIVTSAESTADPPISGPIGPMVASATHPPARSSATGWLQNRNGKIGLFAGFVLLPILAATIAFRVHHAPVKLQSIRSLAVLPFRSEGAKEAKPYLGVGVANSIINRLSSSDELLVPTANTIARLPGSVSANEREAGRELGVDAVVSGEIDRSPTETRVSVAVTRVSDGEKLWSNSFTESPEQTLDLADVFEADIATRVSSLILGALGNTKIAHRNVDAANPEARELYFRGRYYWNRRTEDSLTKSIDCFQKAVAADPNFALAYAGLADAYVLVASFSVEPGRQAISSARTAALSAIQLDSGLAEPHASLGMISFFTDWDGAAAEQEFQRALALEPNYATAHHWYALDLAAMGRADQASYEVRKAQDLDPMSSMIGTNVGWVLYLNRHYDEAEQAFRNVLEMDPGFVRAHTRFGITLLTEGKNQAAVQELRQALALSGDPYVKGVLAEALAVSGNRAEANRMLSEMIKDSRQRYVQPFGIALAYLGLGQRAQALEWLQKAFDDHTTTMVWAKIDPELDQLRSTPELQAILAKMKL
jgi:DNA-binding winged helix-turn-helix (wHTH) protein/TolB-like protein/Flp pilus assembly protein TadD